MFAPTASQMLRDDRRLRDLHRDTKRRRKRFLAKQKQLEDEEEHRRINALKARRNQRNRHVSAFRNKPIRAQRDKMIKTTTALAKTSSFIVPVCDQLPSPTLSPIHINNAYNTNVKKKKQKRNRTQSTTDIRTNTIHKICEKKMDLEVTENEQREFEHFQSEISDQQSIADLDNFEMKHFGVQQSIDDTKANKENYSNVYSTIHSTNSLMKRKSNGYQQLFEQKIEYKKDKVPQNENNRAIIKPLTNVSINGSLYNINDVDMKTPEDNDSVKINPKDSVDCSKMSFSTIYNSNLLPLQSILESKHRIKIPKAHSLKKMPHTLTNKNQIKSYYSDTHTTHKSYGLKLPRLTRSILREKDRIDSRKQQSPKSTFSAPVWNKCSANDIGYSIAMNRRRNTTTIIDDFFTKTSDDFMDSHRTSNNTMFLPKINRSKLKPKSRLKQKPAYSVMSQYDTLREDDEMTRAENKLQQSLLRINETLSNLTVNEPDYTLLKTKTNTRTRNHSKQKRYPNYMNDTTVSSIPRKIKVKKSPTFKSNRRRRRWNR